MKTPERALCEATAFLVRLSMGIAGTAVVVLNLLWLGVPDMGLNLNWSNRGLQLVGALVFMLGFAGFFAPQWRGMARRWHTHIVASCLATAVLASAACTYWLEAPWIGSFGAISQTLVIGSSSLAGGLCFLCAGFAPMRRRHRWDTLVHLASALHH